MNPTPKRLLILLVSFGAIAAAIALFLPDAPPPPSPATTRSLAPSFPPLTDPRWAEFSPNRSAHLRLIDNTPTLHIGALAFAPTPTLPHTRDLRWTHTRGPHNEHLLQGKGTWQGHPLTWQWVIRPHDPHASLSLSLGPIPWQKLDRPIVATLPLPKGGSLSWVNGTYTSTLFFPSDRIDFWQGTSLTLTPQDAPPITWTNIHLDHLSAPTPHALSLSLFDPNLHPFPSDCDLPFTISAQWTMTLGTPFQVSPSRLPEGYLAAIAPTFVDPSWNPDAPLQATGARSASDLAKRIQTLQFGHSDPQDPRYGNGGLTGLGAGASFVIPKAWANEKEITSLATLLSPTRSTLAIEGDPTGPTAPFGSFLSSPSCATLKAPADSLFLLPSFLLPQHTPHYNHAGPQVAVTIDGKKTVPSRFTPHPQHPQLLSVPLHSGIRSLYDTQTFSRKALSALLKFRGISFFLAPLVAERNPLIPAAKQSLLEPESHGHWTLSAPFTQALSTIELLNEEQDLLLSPPHTLLSHVRHTRDVIIHQSPGDGLTLYNPSPSPIHGFTLILPQHLSPKGITTTRQRILPDANGDLQAWITWTLPPGTSALDFQDMSSTLEPIMWQFDLD